jgi:hypothetical protein
VQNWSVQTGSDYRSVPGCLDSLWVTASSRSYSDVQYPAVAAFRAAMRRYFPARESKLSQWELEGWAAAQWFADAADSCGAAAPSASASAEATASAAAATATAAAGSAAPVDRACLERFLQRPQPYDAHGLLIPTRFSTGPAPTGLQNACLDVARWQGGPGGGWVTQVADMDTDCFQVPALPYRS